MKLIGTILPSDPYDEREGAYMSSQDWRKFDKLPAGTKIYAVLPLPKGAVVDGQRLGEFTNEDS